MPDLYFEKVTDIDFVYQERLGPQNILYIIGGGHCALALSELMSKLDFRIAIFDDRPELNTIAKNRFADEISIIESYGDIGDHIASGTNAYVVVMTLGYASDEIVIRKLLGRSFKYFGVLGSKAKMKTLLKNLKTGRIRSRAARRNPHAYRPSDQQPHAGRNCRQHRRRDHLRKKPLKNVGNISLAAGV